MTLHAELNAMVEALHSGDLMAATAIADMLEELDDPRAGEARKWANLITQSESSFTLFIARWQLLALFRNQKQESKNG